MSTEINEKPSVPAELSFPQIKTSGYNHKILKGRLVQSSRDSYRKRVLENMITYKKKVGPSLKELTLHSLNISFFDSFLNFFHRKVQKNNVVNSIFNINEEEIVALQHNVRNIVRKLTGVYNVTVLFDRRLVSNSNAIDGIKVHISPLEHSVGLQNFDYEMKNGFVQLINFNSINMVVIIPFLYIKHLLVKSISSISAQKANQENKDVFSYEIYDYIEKFHAHDFLKAVLSGIYIGSYFYKSVFYFQFMIDILENESHNLMELSIQNPGSQESWDKESEFVKNLREKYLDNMSTDELSEFSRQIFSLDGSINPNDLLEYSTLTRAEVDRFLESIGGGNDRTINFVLKPSQIFKMDFGKYKNTIQYAIYSSQMMYMIIMIDFINIGQNHVLFSRFMNSQSPKTQSIKTLSMSSLTYKSMSEYGTVIRDHIGMWKLYGLITITRRMTTLIRYIVDY